MLGSRSASRFAHIPTMSSRAAFSSWAKSWTLATRTLQIRIEVPNPQGLLKPEMYATAKVQQSGMRAALVVPEEAIQEIDGVSMVFVRDSDNEFRARTVEPGEHAAGGIEILQGLQRGEPVVVKGSFALKSQLLKARIQDE